MNRFVTAITAALSTSIGAASEPPPELSHAELPSRDEVRTNSLQQTRINSYALSDHETARVILAPFENQEAPTQSKILDRLNSLAGLNFGRSDINPITIRTDDHRLASLVTELSKLTPSDRAQLAESIETLAKNSMMEERYRALSSKVKFVNRPAIASIPLGAHQRFEDARAELLESINADQISALKTIGDLRSNQLAVYHVFAHRVEADVIRKQWAQYRDSLNPSVKELFNGLPEVTRVVLAPWSDTNSAPSHSDLVKRIQQLATIPATHEIGTASRTGTENTLSIAASTLAQQNTLAEAILADLKMRTIQRDIDRARAVLDRVASCVEDGVEMQNYLASLLAFEGRRETAIAELKERTSWLYELEEQYAASKRLPASTKEPTK
jgi:hypothetical protein